LKGPISAIGFKERAVLDDKLALQEEFRFNGTMGGVAWKGKLERYFISRAPDLRDLLKWAEEEDMDKITDDIVKRAVGQKLTEEQVLNTNAALWGALFQVRLRPCSSVRTC